MTGPPVSPARWLSICLYTMAAAAAPAHDPWSDAAPAPAKQAPALTASTALLTTATDSAPDGDGRTHFPVVDLTGRTVAGARVAVDDRVTTADPLGYWTLHGIPLEPGTNVLSVELGNAAATHRIQLTIIRTSQSEEGDAVLQWNAEVLDVIRRERLFPPPATRLLAMAHLAMRDALASGGEPAVAAAAHGVLAALHPAQAAELDARLALTPGLDEPARAAGRDAARHWIDTRANDGADATVVYTPVEAPGRWQPTRPGFRPPITPHWGGVRPFSLDDVVPYRPPGPPALDSAEYEQELAEVRLIGEYFSTARTPDGIGVARFWADQTGTSSPAGHWNRIAATVARDRGLPVGASARLFAVLNIALADATIACWESKFHFDFWRPVTAINDELWAPAITTPPFPEYPSGHSVMSGAAATVLNALLGHDVPCTSWSEQMPLQFGEPDVARHYPSFDAAAAEASRSRVLGGIHFTAACRDGLAQGRAIGAAILATETAPPAAWMLW